MAVVMMENMDTVAAPVAALDSHILLRR